jgi:hypothetical protein
MDSKIKMRFGTCLIVLCFLTLSTSSSFGQSELKRTLINDLYLTNELFNYHLLDTNTAYELDFNEGKGIREVTYATLSEYFDEVVHIESCDSFGLIFNLEVKFKFIDFRCLAANNVELPLLSFVVIKSGEEYLKIDGFASSQILLADLDDVEAIKYLSSIKINVKKLLKSMKRRNMDQIKTHLHVSVLKAYNDLINTDFSCSPVLTPLGLGSCENY